MKENDLPQEINGWSKQNYDEDIHYWRKTLDTDEGDENWSDFFLVIQDKPEGYDVSISVSVFEGVDDLLNAEYSSSPYTIEEALEIGSEYIRRVEEKYDL